MISEYLPLWKTLNMKNSIISILFLIVLLACNSSESTKEVATSPATSTTTNQPAQAIPTSNPSVSSTSPNDEPAEAPNIKIKIQGGQPGRVRLIGMYTDRQYLADSSRMNANGEVILKNSVSNGESFKPGLYFLALQQGGTLQLLIDKDQTFSMTTNINDLVGAMKVEGSADNEVFYSSSKMESALQTRINEFTQQMKNQTKGTPGYENLSKQRAAIIAERKANLEKIFQQHPNSFFTAFKRAGQNPEVKDIRKADGSVDDVAQVVAYRNEFWDNVNFADIRLLNTPVISNKLKRYINELTPQHPDSIIQSASFLVDKSLPHKEYFQYFANWITLNYDPKETTLMDPQAVYTYMIQNYFTKERAFWSSPAEIQGLQTRAYEMAASIIGKQAPDVTAKDHTGQMKSIYEMKAPYILVYMYNPDCEHCQEQTPKLVQFYNEWKNKGVDVYAIAVDTEDQPWKDYIAKTGMTFTNVHDPTNRAIYAKYYVDQTPELYVLNPDRTIIGKNLKVNQVETIINRDKNK